MIIPMTSLLNVRGIVKIPLMNQPDHTALRSQPKLPCKQKHQVRYGSSLRANEEKLGIDFAMLASWKQGGLGIYTIYAVNRLAPPGTN